MLPPGDWHCTNCSCRYCGLVSDAVPEGSSSASSMLLTCSQCEEKCSYIVIRFSSTSFLFFITVAVLALHNVHGLFFVFVLNSEDHFGCILEADAISTCSKDSDTPFCGKSCRKVTFEVFDFSFQSFQSACVLTIISLTQTLVCLY